MEYTLRSGKVVTDEQIEAMAEAIEDVYKRQDVAQLVGLIHNGKSQVGAFPRLIDEAFPLLVHHERVSRVAIASIPVC